MASAKRKNNHLLPYFVLYSPYTKEKSTREIISISGVFSIASVRCFREDDNIFGDQYSTGFDPH